MIPEFIERLRSVERRLDGLERIGYGTVAQASPLRVRLDGDAAALPYTPNVVNAGPYTVGGRVLVIRSGRRVVVIGPLTGG